MIADSARLLNAGEARICGRDCAPSEMTVTANITARVSMNAKLAIDNAADRSIVIVARGFPKEARLRHPAASPVALYYVYVIELADAAGPRSNSRYPNVYVGQSACLPAIRFQQHKAGYRASRHVRRHGLWLRHRLYRQYNPLPTRQKAVALEEWLAGHLKGKGYTVYGGH